MENKLFDPADTACVNAKKRLLDTLTEGALGLGATKASVIAASDIPRDREFRAMCAANACGVYGKCWMCPPDVGDIDALMAEIGEYDHALVYQTVTELEDSFDYEGMIDARRGMSALSQKMRKLFDIPEVSRVLHLSVGGCGVCAECTKKTGEPCRHPDLAMPSLEAYGVNVSGMAGVAGMKYINGKDTVTYFGAVLFDLDKNITVTVDGRAVSARRGDLLSEIVKGEKPCGGHGKCGKCKVVAHGMLSEISDAERRLLTDAEIERGVRLACMTKAFGDSRIETALKASDAQILTSSSVEQSIVEPTFTSYGVAVDIGTTTLAATLFSKSGKRIATEATLNPQSRWGADVVSRIEKSMAGEREALAEAVRVAIVGLIEGLAQKGGIKTEEIDGAVITGNTVMLALLCGDDVEPFSHAPFDVKELYGKQFAAKELGLDTLAPDATVYLPPCISAFVGADTVCAILSTALCENDTAMLADIGTNGEIALQANGKLTVCSTAAGPAFEGVGISMGMRGERGAIDKVALANGRLVCHTIGEVAPVGICGSGLVDAVACMLMTETIDESGFLEDDTYTLEGEVELTQKDIRMVQLAKSAICAGIEALVAAEKAELTSIRRLYIAGGFGNYLNMSNSVAIGLLPRELGHKIQAVGNAALAGAEMLLVNKGLREKAALLGGSARVLELSTDPVFSEKYMMGMSFEEF
jgi:uncharacterized 2Fe-2S/4Fe-4S cluster protein (DUF4445 family)/predicted metal-binding protein